jgi:hypothetical protein
MDLLANEAHTRADHDDALARASADHRRARATAHRTGGPRGIGVDLAREVLIFATAVGLGILAAAPLLVRRPPR